MVIWIEGDETGDSENKHEDGMGVSIFVFISILLVPTANIVFALGG